MHDTGSGDLQQPLKEEKAEQERDENVVFEEYRKEGFKEGESAERINALQRELIRLLSKHAGAVCWETLHRVRPDVVNAALVRAFTAMGKFRGDSKFSTWFHRIAVNECKRVAAAEGTRAAREVSLEDMEHEPTAHAALEDENELHRRIVDLLGPMSSDRAFYCDKMCRQYSDLTLGDKYGLSPAGVRVRWHRIRKKLQGLLRSI